MVCFCISKCSEALSDVIALPKEDTSLFQGSFLVGKMKSFPSNPDSRKMPWHSENPLYRMKETLK